jgi:methylated-DNA-[protein]-cysteine S-methyltransferase
VITDNPEARQVLDRLLLADEQASARLHARLVAQAQREGMLDVAYRMLDTPVGTLLLAATGQGLVRVAYDCEGTDRVLAKLAATVSPRILRAPGRLDDASRQLEEYFAGRRKAFDLPLDLRLSRGFRRTVLAYLPAISYGRTQSYTEVAAAAGNAKAVRATGSACATNPLPVVVPCHRVVRTDGSLGGYISGLSVKRALLDLEAAG